MLYVLVGEAPASWTLSEADAAAELSVIGGGVGGVERRDGVGAFDTDEERTRWSAGIGRIRGC